MVCHAISNYHQNPPAGSQLDPTPLDLRFQVRDREGRLRNLFGGLAVHAVEGGVGYYAAGQFQQQLETVLGFLLAPNQIDELTSEFLCGYRLEIRLARFGQAGFPDLTLDH